MAHWVKSQVTKKIKGFECGAQGCIHNTSFSLYLANGTSFAMTKTLAYRAKSQVAKKMKCCENGMWGCIHNTSFSS